MGPDVLSSGMQRLGIIYRGRVQGVGFRVTALGVARGHAVSGWVRNEPDGSVRLEVQGKEGEIEALRAGVRLALGGGIEDEQAMEIPVVPGEQGFEIRYW